VLRRRCVIINVYAKCDVEAKKRLWERLILARRNLGEGAWCILGDFNVVGARDERRGVDLEASPSQIMDMNYYQGFVRDVELEDHKLLGRKFTWYHLNGRSMSRIDRVLISEEWNRFWGDTSLWVLHKDVSDHYPVVLKTGGWDWGPKPFWFNNFWLDNNNFKGVVEEVEGEKNHKKGGLNCVFGNFFFYVLKNCSQVQSLSEFRVFVQRINVKNRRRKNTCNYTGSFHKPEVVLSPLHFQGEFH